MWGQRSRRAINFLEHFAISNPNEILPRSCHNYSCMLLILDVAWTSNDFSVETASPLRKYHTYTKRFLAITRHMRWLLARQTVPVPATRADRREINETCRQLQPLQPMLFQRIIDLSSDPSRSYTNPCFHVGREMCAGWFYAVAKLSSTYIAKLCSLYMRRHDKK